jgi:aspartate racemase
MARGKLGIVGGMGPLASAEFVATIYRLNLGEREQEAPALLLDSDPSFPDRTEVIRGGRTEELGPPLAEIIRRLVDAGAERVVIACMTVHAALDLVPEALSRRVVSLVDVVVEEALADPRPRLLLATTGTRQARLFEGHRRFGELAPWLRFLGDSDQAALHEGLYRIKRLESPATLLPWIEALPARYGVEGFVFGCTELHLAYRLVAERTDGPWAPGRTIDPLASVARDLPRLLAG